MWFTKIILPSSDVQVLSLLMLWGDFRAALGSKFMFCEKPQQFVVMIMCYSEEKPWFQTKLITVTCD
jgi:hypothetical protein